MMSKKRSNSWSGLLTRSARFLFPGDARHSQSHVNKEALGDKRTRQYKDKFDRNTGEVQEGRKRGISGQELRANRKREDNYNKYSGKW
jgi:hypothetical protein